MTISVTIVNCTRKCKGKITWFCYNKRSTIDYFLTSECLHDYINDMIVDEDRVYIIGSNHNDVIKHNFASLKDELKGKSVSVIVDETTDDRDKSVLNVLVGNLDQVYLIDIVFMDEVNQRTVAQTALKSLTNVGIEYNNVCCFVRDNCKAAFNNILTNVLPNAIHVGCMAHILNLVGEDLVKDTYFRNVEVFTNDIKKAFKRQPKRKSRYQAHLITTQSVSHEVTL